MPLHASKPTMRRPRTRATCCESLFKEYGPCLILIDEWVAYARQLHDQSYLPAGGFETQFTFAQALTESAKLAGNCLLVISLPASDTSGSPHTMTTIQWNQAMLGPRPRRNRPPALFSK
jgi:hypothetical protein